MQSGADLAYIAKKANDNDEAFNGVYFKQTCDIDLAGNIWVPISDEWGVFFAGHYDGGNYSILNLFQKDSTFGGLFGICGNGSFSNIHIKNSIIHYASYAGGLAYYTTNYTISNCTTDIYFTNCGQVAGLVLSASATTFTDCINYGTIEANKTSLDERFVGGILGGGGVCTINSCKNEGKILAENASYVGGIIGCGYNDTVINCVQNGTIFVHQMEADSPVGVFIGSSHEYGGYTTSYVKNCAGYGTIIVADYKPTLTQDIQFENCFFIGHHSFGKDGVFVGASNISSCYVVDGNNKYYSSGDFSDFRIVANFNGGRPIQTSLFHIASSGEKVDLSHFNGWNKL